MKKWLKEGWSLIQNEKGNIMLYFIIMAMILTPFAIWIGVQLPLQVEGSKNIKHIVYNTADSMISRVDKELLQTGILEVDVEEASEVGKKILLSSFNLDEKGNPSGNGLIKQHIPIYTLTSMVDEEGKPLEKNAKGQYILPKKVGIYLYILNSPKEPIYIKGLLSVNKTSVLVHANIPLEVKGVFASKNIIHHTGFSEGEIHHGNPLEEVQ